MKKRIDPLLKFKGWLPTINQIKNDELRLKKDAQIFFWFIRSLRGNKTIELVRKSLGLPPRGIRIPESSISLLKHYEDMPEYPKHHKVDHKKLDYLTKQVIMLSGKLDERFFHSLKSLIVFDKAVAPSSSVQPLIVIPKIPKGRRIINTDKELWIHVYPGATFRDFKTVWGQVVIFQQELESKKDKPRWQIFTKDVDQKHYEYDPPPIAKRSVYIRVNKNTTLENLNFPKFRIELGRLLKTVEPQRKMFRKWDYKKAHQLLELDSDSTLSDWDKAEKLENNENERSKIKKLRFRARRKL